MITQVVFSAIHAGVLAFLLTHFEKVLREHDQEVARQVIEEVLKIARADSGRD